MNKAYLQTITAFAAENHLSVDYNSATAYGNYNNYYVTVTQLGNARILQISLSVKQGDRQPDALFMKQIAKGNKTLLAAAVTAGYRVRFNVKPASTLKGTVNKKLRAALEIITSALASGGYENCCQTCGSSECDIYYAYNDTAHFCDKCYEEYSANVDNSRQQQAMKNENIVGGVVGALLGSLIGVIAIILIMQLGYIASVSGIIMGVCALKGYEMLGGKLSNVGIIISSVIMVVMVFLSNHIELVIEVARELDCSFFDGFTVMRALLKTGGSDVIRAYITNLPMLYIFTALGAVPTVMNSVKTRKSLYTVYKMGVLSEEKNSESTSEAEKSVIDEIH